MLGDEPTPVATSPELPAAPPVTTLADLDATPTLARQTIVYAVTAAIGPALAVFTLPIFARVFTPREYGLLELAITLTTVVLTVTDLSLTAAAQRSYFDYSDEELAQRRRVLSTSLLVSTIITLLAGVVILVFRSAVSELVFQTPEGRLVALIAATLLPLNTFRFVTEALRLRFKAVHFLITSAISIILGAGLSITFLVGLNRGVDSVFVASLIANGLASLYGLVMVRDVLTGGFSLPELRTMLVYGLPLIPTSLLLWALALIDRVILSRLADLQGVGQYAMALRVTGLLLLGVNAFQLALGPFLFSLYSSDPETEKLARGRTFTYLSFVLGSTAMLLALFSKEVLGVVAPAFPDSYTAVAPLAFGTVCYGLSSVLLTGISLSRRTIFIPFFSAMAALANIGLTLALVPPFGFVGAAFGTGGGYVVLAVLSYVIAQRVYPTPYEPRRVLVILLAAAGISGLGVVPLGSTAVSVAIKVGAAIGFLVVVWAGRAMTKTEFVELGRFVRGMLPRRGASGAPA